MGRNDEEVPPPGWLPTARSAKKKLVPVWVTPTTSLPLLVPRALKYMGRSATMPLHVGAAVLLTLTVAASQMPGPLAEVPRSPSTHAVTRSPAGDLTETLSVPPAPRAGLVR